MARYGTDKPDMRFGMELVDLSEVFAATEFRGFQQDAVKAIRVPGAADLGRNQLDALIDRAKALGAAGLVWMKVGEGGAIDVAGRQVLQRGRADGSGRRAAAPSRATCS